MYKVQSGKTSQFFGGFCSKLARTKIQQIIDKAIKHNWRTVFRGICSYAKMNSNGVNFILFFYTLLITLPQNLPRLHFSPLPLPEYAATPRYGQAYNSVRAHCPGPLTMMTPLFPILSTNHRASGDVYCISPSAASEHDLAPQLQ